MIDSKKYTALSVLAPADRTSTANGTGVDVKDYNGIGHLILTSAAGTGSNPTLDVHVEDSADNSSFADVAGMAFTQVTNAAASLQSMAVNMDAVRRYVRAVVTIGGSSPHFICACVLVANPESA